MKYSKNYLSEIISSNCVLKSISINFKQKRSGPVNERFYITAIENVITFIYNTEIIHKTKRHNGEFVSVF